MILTFAQYANTDERTIGELFCLLTIEAAAVSFRATPALILTALIDSVREFFAATGHDELSSLYIRAMTWKYSL